MDSRLRSMKRGGSAPPTGSINDSEPAKFEVPLDFDDILALAVFDAAVKSKRRKFRRRGRRPKSA
jgi:hypothetical protein